VTAQARSRRAALDAASPLCAAESGSMAVTQRIDLPDAKSCQYAGLDDLANGATALTLVFEGSVGDYGYALPATGAAISEALDNVYLDAGIAIDLELSRAAKGAGGFSRLWSRLAASPRQAVNIRFGFNPLGVSAMTGEVPVPWPEMAPHFAEVIGNAAGQGFAGPFAVADGRVIHAAGGSEAQNSPSRWLAPWLFLRRARGWRAIALERARSFIYFRLAADQDQFLTIAKFRAIRKALVAHRAGLRADKPPSLRRR